MKQLVIAMITFIMIAKFTLSQGHCELVIYNYSGTNLNVKIYPASMVFNWGYIPPTRYPGYNLIANIKRTNTPPYRYDFINGVSYFYDDVNPNNNRTETIHKILNGDYICGQYDGESGGDLSSTSFVYGAGKYRIDFWSATADTTLPPDAYCIIDIDAYLGGPPWMDLTIYHYDYENIKYSLGACTNIPLPANKVIEMWNPCSQ